MIMKIKAIYNDMTIDCVLLAKFDIEVNFKREQKKSLLFKWNKFIACKDYKSVCLVFVPWKHKSKEFAFISKDLVLGDCDFLDKTNIIKSAEFYSECIEYYFDNKPISNKVLIKNFEGYDFIYQNNSFLANLYNRNSEQCYDLLYKNLPEVFDCEPVDDEIQLKTMFVDIAKRKGSAYIEFQYAKNVKKPFKKIDNFKEDSLFIHSDNIDWFLQNYGDLFNNCISPDCSNRFCDYGVNYYTPEMAKTIFDKLKRLNIIGSEKLIVWLDKAVSSGEGFYILGI